MYMGAKSVQLNRDAKRVSLSMGAKIVSLNTGAKSVSLNMNRNVKNGYMYRAHPSEMAIVPA